MSLEGRISPERVIKLTRFFDIFFSLLAIIILLPLMIPIMIGLKLTGEHDIFYGQERIGRGGEPFKVMKFATMLRNSPNMAGGYYTEKNDPRILPMGRFLRKTKINELPQLLNILSGDMSIIGYRPLVVKEFKEYKPEVKAVLAKSRPGLSGIGSIVFRNEEEILQTFDSHEEKDKFYFDHIMPYKGELECWYVQHKSVFMYWKLIFMTVEAVLKGNTDWKKLKGIPQPPKELERFL
ncbi:sugar transferase [Butyrivibrio sp. WCD3002]|uniref:sugar transferase n=1 Tax=Butyrivibrio sp. WCD3002 TaxID=1280676 RepID=UPI002E8E49E2|nr:sugar transferase [Butyrivibrio sp. WCD3002]